MQEIRKENIKLSESEAYEFYSLSMGLYYSERIHITIYLILAIILCAIGTPLYGEKLEYYEEINWLGFTIILISFVLFYLHLTEKRRILKRTVKQHLKTNNSSVYVMNPLGMKEFKSDTEQFFYWDYFSHYIVADKYLFLFEKKNNFNHRFFYAKHYTKEEWSTLLEWINHRVKAKSIVIKSSDTKGTTGKIILAMFAAIFLASLFLFYLNKPDDNLIGKWIGQTDSTRIVMSLNNDKTGGLELDAKGDTFKVQIIHYELKKTNKVWKLEVKYGESYNYPVFFYDITSFELIQDKKNLLYVIGSDSLKKTSWKMTLERE